MKSWALLPAGLHGGRKGGSLARIRTLLLCLFFFWFYSNLPVYLYLLDIVSLRPIVWIVALIAISLFEIPHVIGNRRCVWSPIYSWSGLYSLLCITGLMAATISPAALKIFASRVLAIILMLSLYTSLQASGELCHRVRLIIAFGAIFGVVCNIADVLVPFLFVPITSEFSNAGRAAGFYINANQAGTALTLGAILSIGVIPDKLKTAFATLISLGIILTLSRAAILGWVIVLCIWLYRRTINARGFAPAFIILFIAVGVSSRWVLSEFSNESEMPGIGNVITRVNWFMDPIGVNDHSKDERLTVARDAWRVFSNNPYFGSGMGATIIWSNRAHAHNTYLQFMSEYGILGIWVLPTLVLSVIAGAVRSGQAFALPFAVAVLFWGFFSHNVIMEHYYLVAFALAAAMAPQSLTRRASA